MKRLEKAIKEAGGRGFPKPSVAETLENLEENFTEVLAHAEMFLDRSGVYDSKTPEGRRVRVKFSTLTDRAQAAFKEILALIKDTVKE